MLSVEMKTMYGTLFFTVLMLMAKGWMVTREFFGRRESVSLALLISTLYLCTSVFQVAPSVALTPLLFIYTVAVGIMVHDSTINVRYLRVCDFKLEIKNT
eukprot:Selendium_serpulae@DN5005_c0_g1_i6.p1